LAKALRRRASTAPVPEVIEHAMANGLLFEEEKDLWMLLGDQRSG